jgi:hypothetical protein
MNNNAPNQSCPVTVNCNVQSGLKMHARLNRLQGTEAILRVVHVREFASNH